MRVIVHLSDLHFGRVNAELLEPLRERVEKLAPHLVVVSGDLTQRARPEQFRAAKRFLDSLPRPQVVVPGNHDVPLYNVFQRAFSPLGKYKSFIDANTEPEFIDAEIAVIGIDTTRSMVWKHGRINAAQIAKVRSRVCNLHEHVTKIVVTHHPFDIPENHDERDLVRRAKAAMRVFAECGADILLSGHLHKSHTTHSAERYKIPGHSALIVHAGTATSTRGRGEDNSFNALHITAEEVNIERWRWNASSKVFELGSVERFLHAPDGWHRPR